MFKKRILALLIAIFVLGIVFAVLLRKYDTVFFRALFAALAVISVAFVIVSRNYKGGNMSKSLMAVTLAVAAFSFGVLRVSLFNFTANNYDAFDKKTDTVVGRVIDVSTNGVDVSVKESEIGISKGTNLRLYFDEEVHDVNLGDTITAKVRYSRTDKTNLYSERILFTSSCDEYEITRSDSLLYGFRNRISEKLEEIFSGFTYATDISKAVTIGDRTGLDSYIYTVYKTGGVSHILAISGLHISLIAMSFFNLLLKIKLNRKVSSFLAIAVSLFYTALVGFTPGCLRAAVMIAILLISQMRAIHPDGFTTLSIALLLLIIANPYSLYSISLQLSFLCTLGIISASPIIRIIENRYCYRTSKSTRKERLISCFVSLVVTPSIMSFTSTIFSFPILFTRFDTTSYISPLINVVLVPFFSMAIGISLVAILISPIFTVVATVIAYPAGFIFDLSTKINVFLLENDIGVASTHSPYMLLTLFASFVMIATYFFKRRHFARAFVYSSAFFIIAFATSVLLASASANGKTTVECGTDTSEYVYCCNDYGNLYVDVGGYLSTPDAVYDSGRISLDEYLITKYEHYTYRRFEYLSGSMFIDTVYLPNPQNIFETEQYLRIKELANKRNCDIMLYDRVFSHEYDGETQIYYICDVDYESGILGFDFNGKTISVLCGKYPHTVDSDYIVLTEEYADSAYMLKGEFKYVKESVAEATGKYGDYLKYNTKIKFVAKNSESEIFVYEY